METDPPLTPPQRPPLPRPRPSCSELPAEQMSPVSEHRLLSEGTKETTEEALWKSEKHLCIVLSLLLAEPVVSKPILRYSPVSEALKIMTAKAHLMSTGRQAGVSELTASLASCHSETLESSSLGRSDIMETMAAGRPETTGAAEALTEDFSLLTFSQMNSIMRVCSNDTGCATAVPESPCPPIAASQTQIGSDSGCMTGAPELSRQGSNQMERMITTAEAHSSQGVELQFYQGVGPYLNQREEPHPSQGEGPHHSQREEPHHSKGEEPHPSQREEPHPSQGVGPYLNQREEPHHSKGEEPHPHKGDEPHHSKGEEPHPSQREEPHPSQGVGPYLNQKEEPHHSKGEEPHPSKGEEPHHSKGEEPHPSQREEPHPSQGLGPYLNQKEEPHHSKGEEPHPSKGEEPHHSKGEEPHPTQGTEPHPLRVTEAGAERKRGEASLVTHKPTPMRPSRKHPPTDSLLSSLQDDLDPLSSFMMLRSQQRAGVAALPRNLSYGAHTRPGPKMELEPEEQPKPKQPKADLKPVCVDPPEREIDVKAQETISQTTSESRDISHVIHVQASESQREAYRLLRSVAAPCVSAAREQGVCPASWGEFRTLSPDHTRFLLKQLEMELSSSSARGGEPSDRSVCLYKQVALIHHLVTTRDLLLRCDLSAAMDYLMRAKETDTDGCLAELWTRLRVVQYLSQRNKEPNPKIAELQQQMRIWVQMNRALKPCPKALVITTMDSDCLRTLLVKSLSQAIGGPVSAVRPEGSGGKLDGGRLMESLQAVGCVVACGQHIGPDFPWQCFSLVVEYDRADPSVWATVCRESNIGHVTFRTTVPCSIEADPSLSAPSLEHSVPFVLLVTEGLQNFGLLLQMLESVYNMTVLERDYPHSLQMLGGTHRYSVVTVDESTAVVIQDVQELSMERASESMVLRLTALSLQYSCCWVILYCAEGLGEGYNFSSKVFHNLVLIYSAFVLFGLKSEDLDVKVLIAGEAADLAGWISRIAHHALQSCGRDPLTWLSREWLPVVPSEEEKHLVSFPSISPLVAPLMLRRAPCLDWLLGATLSDLQELLPEVPHKVLKLFSDTTALYKLNVSHSPPESPGSPCDPCGLVMGDLGAVGDSLVNPFKGSPHLEDIVGDCPNERPFGRREGTADIKRDFSCFGAVAVKSTVFQQSGTHGLWGVNETRGVRFAGHVRMGRGTEWTARPPLPDETTRSLRDTQSPSVGNPFRGRSSLWHGNSSQQSGSGDCQVFAFSRANAHLRPNNTSATYLTLPTPTLSQWNGRTGPFGPAPALALGTPPQFGGDTRTHPEIPGCLRTRLERKRGAGITEKDEPNAGFPHLKKGKLTYEKVPGRSDGQTRLMFF